MLLTFEPVPADFSQQLIDGIVEDIREIAEGSARQQLEELRQEQRAKYQALLAAGRFSPERLATLSEHERKLLDQLSMEEFDEGLAELDEKTEAITGDPGEANLETDDSVPLEIDESEVSDDE